MGSEHRNVSMSVHGRSCEKKKHRPRIRARCLYNCSRHVRYMDGHALPLPLRPLNWIKFVRPELDTSLELSVKFVLEGMSSLLSTLIISTQRTSSMSTSELLTCSPIFPRIPLPHRRKRAFLRNACGNLIAYHSNSSERNICQTVRSIDSTLHLPASQSAMAVSSCAIRQIWISRANRTLHLEYIE
jgi:hypothetical protein